jgi:hypothetical protein
VPRHVREIQALALLAENKRDEAEVLLRDAAAKEQAMPIEFGPPFVDKPAPELLGDVLLAMGRATDAAAAYESALRRAPNRAASVSGLALARCLHSSPPVLEDRHGSPRMSFSSVATSEPGDALSVLDDGASATLSERTLTGSACRRPSRSARSSWPS